MIGVIFIEICVESRKHTFNDKTDTTIHIFVQIKDV